MINDLWYKNAVVYCLSVATYMDANGDGVGDFKGLVRRLDYLQGMGITAVWLMPFQTSPCRDDGYDVADYYNVDPRYGTLGDFVEFTHGCAQRGIRVLIDLVVNHTSNEHPWFREASADPKSKYRDWYVWSQKKPADADSGVVFPGVQKSTWTWDKNARAYYFHRFYDFQPDLNTAHPEVQAEILKIMGFWLQLGVDGFRMDAVPFVIARKGAEQRRPFEQYDMLRSFSEFLTWRKSGAIILGEANVMPKNDLEYFGEYGERLQMMFNFNVNQHLFYAMASGDPQPLIQALENTKPRPATAQWGQFLRNHDELDLGRLTTGQREKVFAEFGPDKSMQLYKRGIRRRLAPMLHGDRRRLELAYSLMMTLPGTPVLRYGDEIGMGDDLRPAGAQLRAHSHAVVDGTKRRFHHPRQANSSRDCRGRLRLSAGERRRAAHPAGLVPQLDGAHRPHAQRGSGDWLGRFLLPAAADPRRAGHAIHLAQQLGALPPQPDT